MIEISTSRSSDATERMKVTCQECDREVSYREIDADTRLKDEEFVTHYRCPYCEAELDGIEVD